MTVDNARINEHIGIHYTKNSRQHKISQTENVTEARPENTQHTHTQTRIPDKSAFIVHNKCLCSLYTHHIPLYNCTAITDTHAILLSTKFKILFIQHVDIRQCTIFETIDSASFIIKSYSGN